MKKSLVALAALAATSAFAQFSIDGNMDAGFQSIDYKGAKVSGFANNGANTSQINFRGKENLGGGLSADFRVETDWNTVSNGGNQGNTAGSVASSFGNGEIRTGLAGGFGRIDIGAVNFNGLNSILTGQPFGTAIGGGYGTILRVNAAGSSVRSDNSFKYTSPAINGVSVTAYKANKQTNPTTNTFSSTFGNYDMQGSQEVGVNYNAGPINVAYSTLTQDAVGVSTGIESKVNTLGANYTMGALTVYALNQTNKSQTNSTVDTNYTSISAKYAMGAHSFLAQAGSLKNDVTSTKSSMTGLGYNYDLSKMSNIYVRYESMDDAAGVAANPANLTAETGNNKRTRTAVGIKVGF